MQVRQQALKNQAYSRLLTLSMHTLEHCLSGLREIVYTKTNESLAVHRKYINAIHAEQAVTSQLELENVQLEAKIFEVSRLLRKCVRASTAVELGMERGSNEGYKSVQLEKSPDYVLGLVQTLSDGLNEKYTF